MQKKIHGVFKRCTRRTAHITTHMTKRHYGGANIRAAYSPLAL